MWWSFSQSMSHDMLNVITTMANAGGAAPILRLYTGSVPIDADASVGSATVFCDLTCAYPLAPPAANKTLTFSPITPHASVKFPTDSSLGPTFFRLLTSTGVTILQGDVTATGLQGIIQIDYANMVANTPAQVKKLVLTLG